MAGVYPSEEIERRFIPIVVRRFGLQAFQNLAFKAEGRECWGLHSKEISRGVVAMGYREKPGRDYFLFSGYSSSTFCLRYSALQCVLNVLFSCLAGTDQSIQ